MFDFPLFPDQASTIAERVDRIYYLLNGLAGIITILVIAFIVYFGWKYWHGSNVDRGNRVMTSAWLEWGLIGLLTVLALGTFVWAAGEYFDMMRPPRDEEALELFVVGRQWMWEVQHPEGKRELNELHVPLGRTVKLTVSSEDVIHSFYIPAFRIKRDVLPGRYSSVWFEADEVGTYHLFCAEYCGTEHSKMRGRVRVMRPSQYAEWLSEEEEARPGLAPRRPEIAQQIPGQPNAMAAAGEQLFTELGCNDCHGASAGITAPALRGIYNTPRLLQNGETVVADEDYLRESILVPSAQVRQGYDPIMPPYQGQLDEEQLMQLIEYIKYLSNPEEGSSTGDEPGPVETPGDNRDQ